ncbi:MAG: HK97 gp10 family phage protein [Kineosporiaceae bacterium]|nr:HK97 gp10 family phage protein [Aeromicrobium sp.]
MAEVKIDLDPDVEALVAKLVAEGDDALALAKGIASVARSTAPSNSGNYASSIVAEKTKGGARVYSSSDHAAHVEFGVPSRGQVAHFTFRRAADALGLKFDKKGS